MCSIVYTLDAFLLVLEASATYTGRNQCVLTTPWHLPLRSPRSHKCRGYWVGESISLNWAWSSFCGNICLEKDLGFCCWWWWWCCCSVFCTWLISKMVHPLSSVPIQILSVLLAWEAGRCTLLSCYRLTVPQCLEQGVHQAKPNRLRRKLQDWKNICLPVLPFILASHDSLPRA